MPLAPSQGKNPWINLPRSPFVYHENHIQWPRRKLGTPAVWGERIFCMSAHKFTIDIQGGKETSAIIVTNDYLCYKEPNSPYNFFILILNEIFKFKTSEEWQHWKTGALLWTGRTSTFCLRSHRDPFAFFKALARFSDQKINMILRKLYRTRKIFLKIILHPCRINLLMKIFFRAISNDISSTTWTKQNKKHHF